MGLYLKSGWYHFRRQIEGKLYYKALKLRKGQERLLSERLEQVENQIVSRLDVPAMFPPAMIASAQSSTRTLTPNQD